jgi:hypothetical protein
MQQCDDGPHGIRGTGTARHTPKPFSGQEAPTNPESPHKRRNGQPLACLLASGETSYRRSALAGSCIEMHQRKSTPNSLALGGDASGCGGISLGSRAAAPVLHIHPGPMQGFFVRGSVGFLNCGTERLPAARTVPRAGRVRLIDINRGAISTGRSVGRFRVCRNSGARNDAGCETVCSMSVTVFTIFSWTCIHSLVV